MVPKPTTVLTEVKEELDFDDGDGDIPLDMQEDLDIKQEVNFSDQIDAYEHNIGNDDNRGVKRRASDAFSDVSEEDFIGFEDFSNDVQTEDYCRVLGELFVLVIP